MSSSITFDEIERETERTLGYALLAKAARNYCAILYRMNETIKGLDLLVGVLRPETIQKLTSVQAESLLVQLQQIHRLLRALGHSGEIGTLRQLPLLGVRVDRLQERAEAVSDIIDNFQLIGDPGLKRLISDCHSSII